MTYEVFIENFTDRFKIGKRDLLREKMEEWEYEFYSSEFKINKFVCKRYINNKKGRSIRIRIETKSTTC